MNNNINVHYMAKSTKIFWYYNLKEISILSVNGHNNKHKKYTQKKVRRKITISVKTMIW